jgi:hypothetical protein
MWFLAIALLAAGCDRQLNAEWCSQHREDQDCINAGLVQVDAPLPCPAQPCTTPGALVCDTGRAGICVQCVPGGVNNPPGCHCGTDDACHECLINDDCGPGGLCLPDYTCVGGSGSGSSGSPDNLLYATPNGTGDCTAANKCTLATAISMVTTTKHVIELDAGTYAEGPLTIGQTMVLIGPNPGSGHVYQDPEDTTGRAVITSSGANGPVLTVTGGTVALFELTVEGSKDASGVKCTNATVEVYHDVIRDNPQEGITATGCPLTVERSVFTKNGSTGTTFEGLYVNNSAPIAVRNNFFFDNGNSNSVKGAVHFVGFTVGDFRFNSVGYNHAAKSGGPGGEFTAAPAPPGPTAVGGVLCESGMMMARDNIVSLNDSLDFGYTAGGCQTMNSYIGGDPKFTSTTDLHLTAATPSPAVVNNTNSDCSYAKGYDIDFDARPLGGVCDLGADEAR